MRPYIGCIIQARLTSTRLPRKHLLHINGRPILEHLVERARACDLIERVIIASPQNPECCLNEDIFIGNEHDVLDRYYQCAKHYKFDAIVRLTADCPLVPVYEINRVIKAYLDGETSYVTNVGQSERFGTPDGWDVEIFSFKALEEAWNDAEGIDFREHVTGFIKENDEFNPVFLEPLKLSVDTEKDFEVVRDFYEQELRIYDRAILRK